MEHHARRQEFDELTDHKAIYHQLIETAEELGNNQSSSNMHSLMRSIRESNYIVHGGQYRTRRFMNTCVLDSLLAGCHIAANVYPNIKQLFEQDFTVNAVMTLLDRKKYEEAKALWLINVDLRNGHIKHFAESDYIDIRGYVKDHLPNFLDLTSAKYHFEDDRRSPNPEDRVYSTTLSKFEEFGDVRALGPKSNPQLILVDVDGRTDGFPALIITDDYGREFKLQFLLLGKTTEYSNHMVLCTSLAGGWWLYDDVVTPLFREVQMKDLQNQGHEVHLAAYVHVPAKNGKQD
ncbi:uncharacterized protein LOC135257481 isoform X2 [Anguilla rostrata]|uniref:uncharacterized protein LOC135257481 isoform X2 n=1 Tax=Anguilla rostrata TaxID=7938 RepID=UPI0030CE6101